MRSDYPLVYPIDQNSSCTSCQFTKYQPTYPRFIPWYQLLGYNYIYREYVRQGRPLRCISCIIIFCGYPLVIQQIAMEDCAWKRLYWMICDDSPFKNQVMFQFATSHIVKLPVIKILFFKGYDSCLLVKLPVMIDYQSNIRG